VTDQGAPSRDPRGLPRDCTLYAQKEKLYTTCLHLKICFNIIMHYTLQRQELRAEKEARAQAKTAGIFAPVSQAYQVYSIMREAHWPDFIHSSLSTIIQPLQIT
jgi:hypothetical protein